MGRRPRSIALTGAIALIASTIGMGVVAPAAQADERFPAGEFEPCVSPIQFYCVDSVTFEAVGFPAQKGVWVPTGEAIPQPAPDDSSVTPTPPALQPTSTNAKLTYPGRWSFAGFPVESVGYDGVYVQVSSAGPGSDFAWIRMQPASARADGTVGMAVAAEGSSTQRDLDERTKLTVILRFGPLEPTANVMIADGKMSSSGGSGANNVTFSGYPTDVPTATSAACKSETGKASAIIKQMVAFVVFGNTRQSFGYDGMTGNISVSTNANCSISLPNYIEESGEFEIQVSSPHFAPDGRTVNRGFYNALIPLADAALLFGITDPKQVKAVLEVAVESEDGEEVAVTKSVSVRRGVISVTVTGFEFSSPTIILKVKDKLWKKKYKKAAKKAQKKAAKG